jgi:hypothetical protein
VSASARMVLLAAIVAATGCGLVTANAAELADDAEPLIKLPASPAIITPADGCWYGGEKVRGTAEGLPQS